MSLDTDSGFCREALMAWCEQNRVDFLFGLARNARLVAEIETELAAVSTPDHAAPSLLLRAGHLWLEATGRRGSCAGAGMRRRVLCVGRSGSGRGLALYRVRAACGEPRSLGPVLPIALVHQPTHR